MKFRILVFIFLSHFIDLKASPTKLNYNDCRFIGNNTASVELFCNRFRVKHTINDCFSIFLNSSLTTVNRPNVNLLKFDDCGTDSKHINISSSFFNRFPKLSVLDLTNLTIKSIELNFVDENNRIEIVNASKNDLSEMPKSTFNHMPRLKKLDFSYNKIKMIHSKNFEGAIKLTEINLSNNILMILSGESFSTLENLEFLDLSENQIQTIDNNLFVKNVNLKSLNLKGNPIKRFNLNAFSPLAHSLEIQIVCKQIESLEINCRNIKFHIDEEDTLENVRIFNVSDCRAEKLLGFLHKLSDQVDILDLSFNSIDEINVSMFERFTNLHSLDLSHTNLSRIGFDTFSYQTKLRSLDVSFNRLTDVDATIFCRKFFHLETLNLENNLLTAIDNVTSINFSHLNWLAVSKNRFQCEYLAKFLNGWKNVERLQLAGNPSRYQMNIEGIDCYLNQSKSTIGEKRTGDTLIDEHLSIYRNNINNDECKNLKSLQLWTFGFVAVLLFIIFINFITIAVLCRKCRKRRLTKRRRSISNGINNIQMTERKVKNVFEKRKPEETESENDYEEIGAQRAILNTSANLNAWIIPNSSANLNTRDNLNSNSNPNPNQIFYDVPRFSTLQKSYL